MRWVRHAIWVIAALVLGACGTHLWNSAGGAVPPHPGTGLRVATHNVHYIILSRETGAWSLQDWETRKPALDTAFKALDADLVAFQEMESFARGSDGSVNLARDWLLDRNPDYALAAHGDWQSFPVTQPIFYRKDKLTLRDQGWFFFSDTPDVIYSRTFNGSWPAFSSWAEFEDRKGRVFRAYNVHFEYRSASNRRLSAELVAKRLSPVVQSGMPVVVLGDLNVLQGWAAMDRLAEAGLSFLNPPGTTYHLNAGINLLGAIDHIGLSQQLKSIGGPYVLRGKFSGDWPSDHYPVVADLSFD